MIVNKRLTFIDVARTYAIFLALLAHALVSVGLFKDMGSDSILIKQFTRTATPMFVFMFGFMMEFVYARRVLYGGVTTVSRRLFIRSFQCYFAYALTSFSAFIGEYKSFESFLASLFFLADSRFGNILRAYSVMLIVTPLVLKLRVRFGIVFLILGLVVVLFVIELIGNYRAEEFGLLGKPLAILFGLGSVRGGPSVVGAFSFYIAGMIVATSFTAFKSRQLNFVNILLLLSLLMVVMGYFLIPETPSVAWVYFADFTYRAINAPGYFIIGILSSVLSLGVLYFLVGSRPPGRLLGWFLPIGTSSLISYTLGNIALNLLGDRVSFLGVWFFLGVFFLCLVIVTRNIGMVPGYRSMAALLNFRFLKEK